MVAPIYAVTAAPDRPLFQLSASDQQCSNTTQSMNASYRGQVAHMCCQLKGSLGVGVMAVLIAIDAWTTGGMVPSGGIPLDMTKRRT
jgi:hypothetical protein